MATTGDEPESKLAEISKGDKVKRGKLLLPVTLQIRWWVRPVALVVKIWCILRGRAPSKATIDWLSDHGIKRIIGKIRADDGEEK